MAPGVFKDGVIGAEAVAGDQAWTTHQTGTDVRGNVAEKIGRHEYIELLRITNKLPPINSKDRIIWYLHGGIVNDHVIDLDSIRSVLGGYILKCLQEQSIG